MHEVDTILNHILDTYKGMSDINITVGKPFQVEIDSQLVSVSLPSPISVLTPFHTELFALQWLNNDRRAINILLEQGSADTSYAIGDRARFRVNIFSGRGTYAVVMRRLATNIPTVEQLNLPPILNEMADEKTGLVLITGATGSGKSSTLAEVLHKVNQTRAIHEVTLVG
ncbi:putative protein YggR [Candidatus Entotheonellaceae bacterium PAL068K]